MKKSVVVFLSLCFILMSTGCGKRDVMSKEESDVTEVQESQSAENLEESSDDSIDTSATDEPEQSIESVQPTEPEPEEVENSEPTLALKEESEEILRRLMMADLSKAEVMDATEEWNTVVQIAELPEYNITMYGYNDEEYHDRGVAIKIGDDVNYFDWYYSTSRRIMPELFWDDAKKQLQVALNIYTGTGASAQELHILQQYETGTLADIELNIREYETMLGERLDFSYDEETQLLTLFDKKNNEQLTRVDVSWLEGMKVEHVGAGEISYFRLSEQIWLVFTPGYSVEGWATPQFDNMPELEVELNLTNIEEGTFELGDMRKVGIGETCLDVVMADTDIDFGEYNGYSVQLIMTEGQFYIEEETVSGGGTYDENYSGEYILQVRGSDGKIIDELSLNQDWEYYNICPPLPINFPGKFELCIKDYNEDGFPDFTIGTYGSSSMNIFNLYSVIDDEIVNIGHLTDCSEEFSIELKQEEGSTDLYTTFWNNSIGESKIISWQWNGKEYFQSVFEDWQSAYKYLICHASNYLVDIDDYRKEYNENKLDKWAYLGIHDFEEDGTPELIIGDNVSAAIFTYSDGDIEKVMDLINPWGGINGLHHNDNIITVVNSGSDGSCYAYAGYHDGRYVSGIYDDYKPDKILLNGERVSYDEFCDIFGELEYENISDDRKEYILIEGAGEDTTVTYNYNISYNSKMEMEIERIDSDTINNLEFDKITW